MTRLALENARLGYADKVICQDVSLDVPDGQFTVIVGPNACGKSTLLKSLTRLISPMHGQILLDGHSLHNLPTRDVARKVGLLPQGPIAPDGIRVIDLVSRGRYPHQSLFKPWSPEDEAAVAEAMDATGIRELSGRLVDELSGGQRQRVWMAVALAQQTPILLLDEPTTFLDVSYQIELLELCRKLNRNSGHTLVAVLHDLNQAARYADHIIAMKDGEVVASGSPDAVITEELVRTVFGVDSIIIQDPESGAPLMIPTWGHADHH
ncbi:ferric enterobactin transport ATP-binding protein [Corynebacterium suranareeae]|uniref:Ferric enterobactin transport ATP-binding protein n=1 Tax=Corynebacterium suranareeae TaxID=2506452 RepID=A0A160PV40_9CORY|nr:ABC transporter ATP-binding protein [Corynebacterium suranareeae]BAU97061.1 ferric enterobactin transport ATP-binding protein [Corynebacterium suranareeae]